MMETEEAQNIKGRRRLKDYKTRKTQEHEGVVQTRQPNKPGELPARPSVVSIPAELQPSSLPLPLFLSPSLFLSLSA